ncbi:MAG: ABC transporter ATP-binding protein [Dehalococcoidia bacterium]
MISIKNLTMLYKNGKGVKNISISIQDGETKALLGPNGSGKTTTMRSFMGFLKSSDGTLSVNEIDPISNPIEAKKIIGFLPGDSRLPDNVSSETLFKFAAQARDVNLDYALELATNFDLDIKQTLKKLSKGNKQKTAIILSLLHKPKALILDEPTSGLDPFHQRTLFQILNDFANNGTSILLSSHIISEVEKTVDSLAVMKEGVKIYDESLESFKKMAEQNNTSAENQFFDFFDKEKNFD